MILSDEELVRKVQTDDLRAYEELVNRYKGKIAGFIYRYASDKEEAEEIAQDVFVQTYFNIYRYDQAKGKFSTWLYTIAYNQSVNYMKSKKARIKKTTVSYDDWYEPQSGGDVQKDMELDEHKTVINSALGSLPVKYKSAISLFYIEELSYEEIGNMMRLPLNTVRTHIRRGKVALKKILHEQYGEFQDLF